VTDLQFFLSHAHVDRDPYLERFFTDLAYKVRAKVPLPSTTEPRDIGFFDKQSLDVGDVWSDELVRALQLSRTFVPVVTRGLVSSESCGRELWAFTSRLPGQDAAGRESSRRRVLPVMWERPSRVKLPSVLEPIQWNHADLGETYAEKGLAYLSHRGEGSPDYVEFVEDFAFRIVSAAKDPLPPQRTPLPSWDASQNAFSTPESSVSSAQPAPLGTADPRARFAFIAGRPDELRGMRADLGAYGATGGEGWRPFAPADERRVGPIAQVIAGREGYDFDRLVVDLELAQRVGAAEAAGEVVAIVVDPWTVRLETYRKSLATLDAQQFVNFGILVPLAGDGQGSVTTDELRLSVQRALPKTYLLNRAYVRDAIDSPEAFERELVTAIAEAQRRMAQLREVTAWSSDDMRTMPLVSGPGGSP